MKLISQRINMDKEIGEINVTPFVDVLLILLIIFMITAPVITKDIKISLPKEKFQKTVSTPQRDFIVTLDSQNRIYYLKQKKNFISLKAELIKYQKQGGEQIFIQADRRLNYGAVVKLMAQIQNLGFQDIGLLVEDR